MTSPRSGSVRRVKVLLMDHSAQAGGGQLGLLRYLRHSSGFDREVVLFEGGPLADEIRQTGTPITVLDGPAGKRGAVTKISALRRLVRRSAPDVLVANSLRSAIILGLSGISKPTMIYYLREDLTPASIRGLKRFVTLNVLLPRFDGFFANSHWTSQSIPLRLQSSRPVEVVYPISGIESVSASRSSGQQKLKILSLSRLSRWKGIHILIEASRLLVARGFGDSLSVTIAGGPIFDESGYAADLEAAALASGAEITFTGHVSDVASLLAGSNVLAHCSIQPEPFGQVLVQAMAYGLAVVTTDQGGPAEVIDNGETGYRIAPNDPVELADALEGLITRQGEIDRLGGNARTAAKRFSDDLMVILYEESVARIIDAAHRGA